MKDTDEDRRSWQNPEEILKKIGLKPGMTFIDVGGGCGFFTIPAAKMLGSGGRATCIDIDRDSLQTVKRSAAKYGLKNIETVEGRAEEEIPCEGCADVVFFGMALHDFQDPLKAIVNARRMLKPNGILVDLDWKKENTGIGPPVSIRFDEQRASKMISSQGFRVLKVSGCGKFHYTITAAKA